MTSPWYKDGLRFGCTGCGSCCLIDGYVWVDRNEIRQLAEHLGLELNDFGRKYLRQGGRRHSLTEIPFPGDSDKRACIFWDGKCTVYDARPRQCRTFPFWRENLATPEDWKETAELSPGVDKGRLYELEEINRLAVGKGETS
ncbi:MAG: YkgJ family cysteine cluster protein [bacterium]|nr:YkgJ family cysteine cluster protein [bacterium]